MKRFSIPALAVMMLTQLASGYENNQVLISPPKLVPQIADDTFINNSLFDVTIPTEQITFQYNRYSLSHTLNFTNLGQMTFNPGFEYQYIPNNYVAIPGVPYNKMSANFVNQGDGFGGGVLNCTGKTTNEFMTWLFNGFLPAPYIVGNADMLISATNIFNSGEINMNASSLLKLTGKNINLNRGQLRQATPMDVFVVSNGVPLNTYFSSRTFDLGSFFFYTGIVDGYWGTGFESLFNPALMNSFQPTVTSENLLYGAVTATTRGMKSIDPRMTLDHVQAYVKTTPVPFFQGGFETSVVFLRNTNAALTASVFVDQESFVTNGIFFRLRNDFARCSVQWQWTNVDFQTGNVTTNYMTLQDSYSLQLSNILQQVTFNTNFFGTIVHGNVGGKLTYQPANFQVGPIPYAGNSPAVSQAGSPLTVFNDASQNGFRGQPQYSAYQAIFSASAQVPGTELHSDVTNMPGRIEIQADASLDLADSRITALSYLLLKATNHFQGSTGAFIQSPNLDVMLRSTNGVLTITNLVVPSLPQPEGSVSCYSLTWQENYPTVTNWFHVLFVDTQFAPVTTPKIQTLSLTATNLGSTSGNDAIYISDSLNVTKNLQLNTRTLTLTTNDVGGFTSVGQLNLLNDDTLWSTAMPRLLYLTNYGIITSHDQMNFAGNVTGTSSSGRPTPYEAFVNRGVVTNQGSFIVAKHFENSGVFQCRNNGNFTLIADCAFLTNGIISAPNIGGAVSISVNSLVLSNHVLEAGGRITLAATNCFSDGFSLFNQFGHIVTTNSIVGTVSNGNFWAMHGNLSIPVKPTTGDLLGTTISNTAAPLANVITTWGGRDVGRAPAGFVNNLAIGRLILNGNTGSRFSFTGTSAGSAMYVDRLELIGSATNLGASSLTNITIGSNMRIYYAQALANGVSIAEKLNNGNGGRFCWVSNYAGVFSSTNVFYSSGITYTFNEALLQSCNIDSRAGLPGDNGAPNCSSYLQAPSQDPIPTNWVFDLVVTNAPCSCSTNEVLVPGSGSGGSLSNHHSAGGDSGSHWLPFPEDLQEEHGHGTNLFRAKQRNFHGLFYDTNGVALNSAGYFSASLTKSNLLSGNLRLGNNNYQVSGRFDTTGHLVKTNLKAGRNSLPLGADLQLSSGGDKIIGQIISSNWAAALLANRLATNVTKGNYTFVIPGGDLNDTNTPAGHGYGIIKVQSDGSLVWSGVLADKAAMAQSSGVSDQGYWPIYSAPYPGNSGLLLGWIHFDSVPTNTDLSGETIWIKPSGVNGVVGKYYPKGFTNQIEVVGSAYQQPPVTSSNGAVALSGGNLPQSISTSFTLKSNYQLANQGTNKFSLHINKNDGTFQGSQITATSPANVKTDWRGVLLQKMGAGYGYFLGTNLSGQVWYTPLP